MRFSSGWRNRKTKFCGVEAIDELLLAGMVTRWRANGFKLAARLTARVTQTSVVSLEPFETDLNVPVDAWFVPEGSKLDRPAIVQDGELVIDPDGADAPEVFTGKRLDVGSLALEFFVLALDANPRLADEKFDPIIDQSETADEPSPFAALAALKTQPEPD